MRFPTHDSLLPRAAVRGIGALTIASLVTKGSARPYAAGAALAVGAGAEDRSLGSALGAVIALVGIARMRKRHASSEALAGAGIGVAVAAGLNHVIPPAAQSHPGYTEPLIERTTPRPDGNGVVVVVDPKSDSGRGDRVLDQIRVGLPAARIIQLQRGENHEQVMQDAAQDAAVLGIAGGDGTVSTAAKVALDQGKPLAVFPAGTCNHFAKTIGCRHPGDTLYAIQRGLLQKVDVATLNRDVVVINTASIGAYPQFVQIRERYQKKLGKPVAAVVAALQVLWKERTVTIRYDGNVAETALFFVGNSVYVPSGFVPEFRLQLDDGLLDVRFVDVSKPWARTRATFALLLGTLAHCPLYHELHVPQFSLDVLSGPTPAAHDGDLLPAMQQLDFESLYRVLPVYRPS